MHVGLPISAFIAAALVLIPLPSHWRAKNIGTLSMIAWLFVSNMIYAINSVIWAGSVLNVAPVWCDIVTKIQIGANIALPASCLCVCMQLARIASVSHARSTRADKLRGTLVDITICWLLPIIFMALHYIVQGHRFDIIEDLGCRPTVYVSVAGICIIWIPPIVVSLLTMGYAAVALKHFFHRRMSFAKHLRDSKSGLSTSQYFRLMSMSVIEMFWSLVITSLDLWFACQGGLLPWISWENVHVGFSQVWYFPTVLIPPATLAWLYAIWYVVPISGALFSVFFSFGEDAMKDYRKSLQWLRTMVLRIPSRTNRHPTVVELPSFNRHRGPMSHFTPPIPPQAVARSPKSASHISFYEMTSNSEDGSLVYSRADLAPSYYSYYVYRPGGMDGRHIV